MGRRIALLIGNTEYRDDDNGYPSLVTPDRNVRDLEYVLKDPARGGFEVTVQINPSKRDADKQIANLFKNKAQDDFLVFYFTGHGQLDSEGELYFAIKETERDSIESTAIAAWYIKNLIDKSLSESIVVILDCCYSGAFADLELGYGRVVLTATDATQHAWDRNTNGIIRDVKNSAFTHCLVEGISTGEADENGDGEITIDELFTYARDKTTRLCPGQTPMKKVHQSAGDLVFAKNPAPSKLSNDLRSAAIHHDPYMRLAATIRLDELLYLYDGNSQLIDQIQEVLEKLSRDPNPLVSKRASATLNDFNKRNAAPPEKTKQLKLFIAAPDDVAVEREIVQRVVKKLNTDSGISTQAQVSIVTWDDPKTYISMLTQATPQPTVLHEEILPPSKCDIVVAIFWSKMGTPLPDVVREDGTTYESVTQWEYEDAVNSARQNEDRPAVLLYRSDQPVIRRGDKNRQEKIAQFRKVVRFFLEWGYSDDSGEIYSDVGQFEAMLEKNLRVVIRKLVTAVPSTQPEPQEQEVLTETSENIDTEKLIKSYLNWIIEQHSRLELRGLGGDAQLPTIPLEKVYVALKAKKASLYEREQSQALLNAEIADIIANNETELSARSLARLISSADIQASIAHPYMPAFSERERSGGAANTAHEKSSLLTLGEAFCKERWMIILGDPGSGKTTLARWIALTLASAWLNGKTSVVVPTYQVDPRVDKADESQINIGPTRLPVLLKVSEYAEAKERGKTSSIVDFLGYHSWSRQSPNLSQEKLNAVIKQYLGLGRVVVILDGMDEIATSRDKISRDVIVQDIEGFINNWINAQGKDLSAEEKSLLWSPIMYREPATDGGNQIVITSRIAGYQRGEPIKGEVAHVTVQPMEQLAIEYFCDAWTLAVHQLLYRNEDHETIQRRVEKEATGLKKAIFDHPRVQNLASNPLLVTMLALVYRKNGGRLPEQRTELYHTAIEILTETWRTTGITTHELIQVLSPLAARIHENYSQGLIAIDEMKEIIERALAKYRHLNEHDLPPAFPSEVDNFILRVQEDVGVLIKQVQKDVGVLSERGKDAYGFLHRTFQEYLTARYLIRDKRNAPQAMMDKLDDPLWREPILMALEHISVDDDWGPEARHHLLMTLLEADDPLNDLIPQSALLIAAAIPGMVRIPENVVHKIIRRLLATYADRDGIGQFATLRQSISKSLKNLYNSKHRSLLEQYLTETLLAIEKGDRNLALASASLVAENKWQSVLLNKALVKAFPYDDPAWGYPITQALQVLIFLPEELKKHINSVDAQEALEKHRSGERPLTVAANNSQIREEYYKRLADDVALYEQLLYKRQSNLSIDAETLLFRKSLEEEPELVEYINNHLSWLSLIVLLYGGVADYGLATYATLHDEIAPVFRLENAPKMRYISQLRERTYWRESWDKDDVVYSLAVYLDTEDGKLEDRALQYIPRFTTLAILNDSPLTPLLLRALRQKKSPSMLKKDLWREWRTASQAVRRAHALLALLIIDTQAAIETLTQSLKDAASFELAELVLNQLKVRKHTLAGSLILLGKRDEIGKSLQPLQDILTEAQWGDMVEIFFRTFTSVMPLPVKYDDVLLAHSTSIPRLNAEIWAYWLSGFGGEDPLYSYAVILDTLGKKLESASALMNMQYAYNSKYDQLIRWSPLFVPPVYENHADIVGEMLTISHQSSSDVMKSLFYVGAMTFAWVNHPDYPGLKEDVLAAALRIPSEYQKDVIRELDTELSEDPAYEATIVERAVSIADPVIRARALWRIAHRRSHWKKLNLWDLSVKAAQQINEPLQRSRAFERLINSVPRRERERIKDEALSAARRISDPNNQARALARLAFYEDHEKHWSLLSDALTVCREIRDEQEQIETLQLLRPYLAENYQLVRIYDDIVKQVKSDWYWHKGKNLLSMRLLAFHDQLHEPQKLTPVVLASLIDELVSLKPQEVKIADLWRQLLDATKREQALSALLKIASANGLDGLYLTPNVFSVLCSLLDTKEISDIYILLPYLRGAEASLLPSLNAWVENPPDKMIWAYAGLLLAEMGQVDPNTIPCLIELIENGIDFGRYRASIVLHGTSVFITKKNRDFRASQLGMRSLLLLMQAQKRLGAKRMPIATPIGWAWHNIIHDDPHLLQQLIKSSKIEEGGEDDALSLLEWISYCDSDTLNIFINSFGQGSKKVQERLLYSWLALLKDPSLSGITSPQQEQMEEAISKLPRKTLESIKAIPARLGVVSGVIRSVSKQIEEGKITSQQAMPLLNQTLDKLSCKLSDTKSDAFTCYTHYNLLNDPINALSCAEAISINSTSLELLFAWLSASLRESIDDFPLDYYRTSTLLELAGAATNFSFAPIYTLCEKHALGPLLVQATMYHRSFWGRAGAATLLGYLRQTPESFEEALLSGLQDVAEVQTAIVRMAKSLRYIDERMIPKLIDLLKHKSASVVYATSKLLVGIVQDEKLSLSLRQSIVRTLIDTIQRKGASRPVFVLGYVNENVHINNIGRLDQQLYSDIANIINIL